MDQDNEDDTKTFEKSVLSILSTFNHRVRVTLNMGS